MQQDFKSWDQKLELKAVVTPSQIERENESEFSVNDWPTNSPSEVQFSLSLKN